MTRDVDRNQSDSAANERTKKLYKSPYVATKMKKHKESHQDL